MLDLGQQAAQRLRTLQVDRVRAFTQLGRQLALQLDQLRRELEQRGVVAGEIAETAQQLADRILAFAQLGAIGQRARGELDLLEPGLAGQVQGQRPHFFRDTLEARGELLVGSARAVDAHAHRAQAPLTGGDGRAQRSRALARARRRASARR